MKIPRFIWALKLWNWGLATKDVQVRYILDDGPIVMLLPIGKPEKTAAKGGREA